MKIFQIVGDFCHWDASAVLRTLSDKEKRFSPDTVFVEAPDFVFEGWGYDASREGDERFIKPLPPEGWLYDDACGTFYREGEKKPSAYKRSKAQLVRETLDLQENARATREELSEIQMALAELYEQMIGG